MYTSDDTAINNTRLKHIAFLLVAILIAAIIALIPTLMTRTQWATDVVACVAGAVIIFIWSMKLTPLLHYRRFLKDMNNGMTHENTCEFVSISRDLMTHDGVSAYLMEMSEGPKEKGEDIRQFYWDAAKPRPEFKEGQSVHIISHGGFVIDWNAA